MALHTHTHNRWSETTRVGRYQKELTHSHPSWSSDILYQLPPFTMIHSILCVQFTCLTMLYDNLSPGPLWSSSWSWTLYFLLHAFLHPVIIFFSQHMPIHAHALFIIIIITSWRRDVLWHVSSSEQCRECWMMDAAAETHATHPMLLSTYLPCQSCTTNTQTRCKFDVYLLKNCNNYH